MCLSNETHLIRPTITALIKYRRNEPWKIATSTKSRGNNNDGAVLISRTLHPRYCSRNYASKIHLLPALTNFRQTRFPGFRKYLHGSAAVIPASRRPLCLLPAPIHPSGKSTTVKNFPRLWFFPKFPLKRDLVAERHNFVVQFFVNCRIDEREE